MPSVYVLGLEPFNFRLLEGIPQAGECEFRELLSAAESVEVPPGFTFDDLAEKALGRIDKLGPADGIVNYFDFPGSALSPYLCQHLGLPAPSLRSVTICEHKYWARREMAKIVPDMTPKVCPVDPFVEDPASEIDLPYPYWLKPIVAHSSYLGFLINSKADLDHALPLIRDKIGHFGDPFNEFLQHVDLPPEIAAIGGRHCLAEEIISADHQLTLEGYVWNGEPRIIGAIDSIREGAINSSFARYDHPSHVPEPVLERMKEAACKLMRHIGFDNGTFNIEYFWDEETDRISVLEINSRMSKSHSPLFMHVDGQAHQSVAVDLALGREPRFRCGQGEFPCASKFMVRLFQDGEVVRVPTERDIEELRRRHPDILVQVLVERGQRLAHLSFQDSYSFEIADIFIGGHSRDEIQRKYSEALETLRFEVELLAPSPEERKRASG